MSIDQKYPIQYIAISKPGEAEVLIPAEGNIGGPQSDEVLISVRAAGVNRPDILQRLGKYPPPAGASPIPGLEVAGVVEAVGTNVTRFSKGDSVVALVPGGGYASMVNVDATSALPLPSGLSFVQGAALPETFFTVWHNVFQRGGLLPDERLLIHGGSSGIGTTAIQIASALGSRVAITAGSANKCDACLELGADLAINYKTEDFVEAIGDWTNGKGVNVILDMVGGDYTPRNYQAAAMDGRIVQIAFLNGPKTEVDFRPLMMKRLTHTGSTLRARSIEFKATIASDLEKRVWPLIESGDICPVIEATFPLHEAFKAHQTMEAGQHIGKLVLIVGDA